MENIGGFLKMEKMAVKKMLAFSGRMVHNRECLIRRNRQMCCKTHTETSGVIVVKATGNYGGCLWNGKPSGGIEWRAPSVEHSGRRPAAGIPGRNRVFN